MRWFLHTSILLHVTVLVASPGCQSFDSHDRSGPDQNLPEANAMPVAGKGKTPDKVFLTRPENLYTAGVSTVGYSVPLIRRTYRVQEINRTSRVEDWTLSTSGSYDHRDEADNGVVQDTKEYDRFGLKLTWTGLAEYADLTGGYQYTQKETDNGVGEYDLNLFSLEGMVRF